MGKYSNIIFVQQDGTIADCIRHVGPTMSSVRLLLPGQPFTESPSQSKPNPLTATQAEFSTRFSHGKLPQAVLQEFEGISRYTATVLTQFDGFQADMLYGFFQELSRGEFHPCLVLGADGNAVNVLPFLPPAGGGLVTHEVISMSAAYEEFYREKENMLLMRRHAQKMKAVLDAQIKHVARLFSSYQDAILSTEKAEECRLCGELITANIYKMQRGQRLLVAIDYYQDPPAERTVLLDPLLSPSENAQRYYKQYRKACLAREHAEKEIQRTGEELNYLEGLRQDLEKCETIPELMEIHDELVRGGYIHVDKKGIRKKYAPSQPMRFLAMDGTQILVGKNNRQNDTITMNAPGEHIWLHVKNAPGSHVIICTESPSGETLYAAAMLAARYSSVSGGVSVPVDYTPRRYVKKPSGAKGGMVIYTTNRTLYVTPDPEILKTLLREDKAK